MCSNLDKLHSLGGSVIVMNIENGWPEFSQHFGSSDGSRMERLSLASFLDKPAIPESFTQIGHLDFTYIVSVGIQLALTQ